MEGLEFTKNVLGYASDMMCDLSEQLGLDISVIEENPYFYCFYMPGGKVVPCGGFRGRNNGNNEWK